MGMPIIIPSTTTRTQAITDIITSVALEQTGLSHILNAEGEKIQKIVATATTSQQMLDANKSVDNLVKSVTKLEMVLQYKMDLFGDCLCPPTSSTSSTTSTTTTSTTTTVTCDLIDTDLTNLSSIWPATINKVDMLTYNVTGMSATEEDQPFQITTNPGGLSLTLLSANSPNVTLSGDVLRIPLFEWPTYNPIVVQIQIGAAACNNIMNLSFTPQQ